MTVRKRANNPPSSATNSDNDKITEDDQKRGNKPNSDRRRSNEDKNTNKTEFPAALTERQKQPNGGSNTVNSNGPLLSIRLDVYHNIRLFQRSLTTFSTQDFLRVPLYLWSVLKDRTKHVDKSITGVSLYIFYLIFALALVTRFYTVSWPLHVW